MKLQELQISEKLWHNLRMCLASAGHHASPQRDVPPAGAQLRKGCIVTAETQTPIPTTESFLCYLYMLNAIGAKFTACKWLLLRQLHLGGYAKFFLYKHVCCYLKWRNALNLQLVPSFHFCLWNKYLGFQIGFAHHSPLSLAIIYLTIRENLPRDQTKNYKSF